MFCFGKMRLFNSTLMTTERTRVIWVKVVSPQLGVETKSWTIVHWGAIVLSVGLYLGFGLIYNAVCYQCQGLTNPYLVMQVWPCSADYHFGICWCWLWPSWGSIIMWNICSTVWRNLHSGRCFSSPGLCLHFQGWIWSRDYNHRYYQRTPPHGHCHHHNDPHQGVLPSGGEQPSPNGGGESSDWEESVEEGQVHKVNIFLIFLFMFLFLFCLVAPYGEYIFLFSWT